MPAQCEMGGQNAAIVFEDADPERTARIVAGAAMGYAGQKCTATSRVIVVGRAAPFLEALVAEVAGFSPGDPSDPATVVGPVITSEARGRVRVAAAAAESDGGRLLTGAAPVPAVGWFVAPMLVDGLAPEHRVAQEETFGPFTTVHHAADLADAVRIANGVRYGLSASLHGSDLPRLLACAERLHTGIVKVNTPTTGVEFYAPFGGEKDSSFGPREQGLEVLSFYSSTRTVTLAP